MGHCIVDLAGRTYLSLHIKMIVQASSNYSVVVLLLLVMVGGPAVGKAGDCLDWIAGGLEIKGLRDSGNPCPL